jgi:hypothetical protein
MVSVSLRRPAEWIFCDRCGTSVDTVLIHREGHHYSSKDDLYCDECSASGEVGP